MLYLQPMKESYIQPQPRLFETKTGEVRVLRGIALTKENAARAEAIVAVFPEKCVLPVPFGEEYPIDLWVKTWVPGRSFKAITEMMAGKRPVPQPEQTRSGRQQENR